MRSRSRKLEVIAFGIAVVLLAVVGYQENRSSEALVESASLVQRTHQIIAHLNGVLAASVDAETGRRGYALTGDEAQLGPYRDATARAAASLAAARALIVDQAQQQRLDALEPLLRARLASLAGQIEVQRTTGDNRARDAENTAAGRALMDPVRSKIAELVAEEERLLASRTTKARESVASARRILMAGTGTSIALFALVMVRLNREVKRRNDSEERSRRNEEDLAITLDSIGDGVIATDAEGLVQRMNPVAQRLTGWAIEEARGRSFREIFPLVHEVTGKDSPHPVATALREGRVVEVDDAAMLVAKDGTKRRVADSAAPIRGAEGAVRGIVLIFRDITQTLEDARVLRRTHAFLDSIFDNIPTMLFVKDAQKLAFVRFNRAGERLLGAKREDLIGKTDRDFFPPGQAEAFIDKDRETLRGNTVVDIPEEPLTTANGIRWLHTKKVPILDEDGEPEYLLGISEDITEQRQTDGLLRTSMAATQVAHRELESFSYSVAHDLRAPLRSIDGFSQALLDDYGEKLDETGKDYLNRVRNSARRMAQLIDDLLGLARVSRTDLARSDVDLTALARQVGQDAKKAGHPDAELVVADGLRVSADARLVRVLLENLLGNAFKFSGKRSDARIEVGVRRDGLTEAFFVRDNGAGFDLTSATKLFTAFQRYHRPTEYEGTGIGLATAERIVSRHGGRIWPETAPGKGATFLFSLGRGDAAW